LSLLPLRCQGASGIGADMVSRLKDSVIDLGSAQIDKVYFARDSVIDLGSAQIDKVRDVVNPHLARTYDRLPLVLQSPISQVASGRPPTELVLDGIRTVGIGFLQRIEAMLDIPGLDRPALADADAEDSDEDADCPSSSSSSLWNIT